MINSERENFQREIKLEVLSTKQTPFLFLMKLVYLAYTSGHVSTVAISLIRKRHKKEGQNTDEKKKKTGILRDKSFQVKYMVTGTQNCVV